MSFQNHLERIERDSVIELSSLIFGDIVPDLQPTDHILPDIFAYWAVDLTGLVKRHVAEDDALDSYRDFEGWRVGLGIGIGESLGGAVGVVAGGA